MFLRFLFAAKRFGHLGLCNVQLQFPLPENALLNRPGDQVVAFDLHVQLFQSCLLRQPEELAANERVKTRRRQTGQHFFDGTLHPRVLRVVP